MPAPEPVQSTPDADARWLNLVRKHVKSLQSGMVQIVVYDSHHFTLAAGYGHFGDLLNHDASGVWGITTKFEF